MKPVFTAISAVLLSGGLGLGVAQALPRVDAAAGAAPAAQAQVEKARVVCGYRGCYRTRYVYRPYGYYRPYYYRPHLGIGIGPFGVGVY